MPTNGSPGRSTTGCQIPMGPHTMTRTISGSRSAALERRWAAIRRKLEAGAEHLATQGVLVPGIAAGRRVWKVRFVVREGGRPVHRAVYIGGDDQPELLERV